MLAAQKLFKMISKLSSLECYSLKDLFEMLSRIFNFRCGKGLFYL